MSDTAKIAHEAAAREFARQHRATDWRDALRTDASAVLTPRQRLERRAAQSGILALPAGVRTIEQADDYRSWRWLSTAPVSRTMHARHVAECASRDGFTAPPRGRAS